MSMSLRALGSSLACVLLTAALQGCSVRDARVALVDPVCVALTAPVRAELSASHVRTGSPAKLTIRIKNGTGVFKPEDVQWPSIPDLEIKQASRSVDTYVDCYTFPVLAHKPGTYTVPATTIQVGDKPYKIDSFTLNVSDPSPKVVPVKVVNRGR